MQPTPATQTVSLREALAVWWQIGVLSFGGPAGQIALMHRIIVDEKRWLDEARFLHALNYCMLLPGPEAQQLATYVGWLLHGVRGGLIAGLLFILPGAVAILALSWLYVLFGDVSLVSGLFFGMKAAVLAIVCQAMARIAQRALRGRFHIGLALAGFIGLFVFALPFPLVIFGAGLLAYLQARFAPTQTAAPPSEPVVAHVRPGTGRAALSCLALWLGTVAVLHLSLGSDNTFTQIADFFSRMAVVTFGGAYAVLSYVAQQAVEQYQWLAPGEMLDGLGLAETTPGPLILVTQFVGFLGAWREAGQGSSLLLASAGALLTTWVTFLPCFVWIFAGAPYVEKLRSHQALAAALSAITAVVVGVIANLALWFAFNFLFTQTERVQSFGLDMLVPTLSSIALPNLLLTLLAFAMLFVLRWHMLLILGSCALLGMFTAVF
jgi:chromate transporter